MKVYVELTCWVREAERKYVFQVGEVIKVKKNEMDFTEVLVKFDDGKGFWIGPSCLEIKAK